MSTSTSAIDSEIATRLAELEARVVAQQTALDAKDAAMKAVEAERDRLREAYEALKLQVELAHRRLVIAKAERIDTKQLELDFEEMLKKLDELAQLEPAPEGGDGDGEGSKKERTKGKRRTHRELHRLVGEERIVLADPIFEGNVEPISIEESSQLMWRRGGMVRVVIARVKYKPSSVLSAEEREMTDNAFGPAVTSTTVTADDNGTKSNDETTGGPTTSSRAPVVRTIVAPLSAVSERDPNDPTIVIAPMPPQLLPGSIGTPSLFAHVATDKFCDGLPLYRQEERFERIGVTIHRSTMARWLEQLGAIVGATIVEAMRKEALATAFCIATDATGILVQPKARPDRKRQPCRRAHFFVQIADADHVFFEYTPVENSEVVSELFRGFSGFVQADAKSVYDVLYRPPDRVDDAKADLAVRREVGCWSHARTDLWEAAVATQDVVAREGLARIMRMFQLERRWSALSPDERKALRDRHLRPHVESFFTFVETEFERVKHQRGLLRSALGYCMRQKGALMSFLDDGRLEMTNNRSERQLRKIATGRKAWLFVGSDDHGQAAGNLLTLIASARLHKLDPEEYLRDVFCVLPHWPRDRYLELAPRYWKLTRARLNPEELETEIAWITVPEPPLETARPQAASAPIELGAAP